MTRLTAQTTADFAATINAAHLAVAKAMTGAVEQALLAGETLHAAKAAIAHGEWRAWLQANCHFSARTAQVYMKLWSERHLLQANAQRAADLPGVRAALRLLAKPCKKALGLATIIEVARALATDAESRGIWVNPLEDGVLFLTPSAKHPGYAFVDCVNTAEGYLEVAKRPIRLDALELFYPADAPWIRHGELDDERGGVPAFVREYFPERVADVDAALGRVAA